MSPEDKILAEYSNPRLKRNQSEQDTVPATEQVDVVTSAEVPAEIGTYQQTPEAAPEIKAVVFEELPPNVVKLQGVTTHDIPIARILQGAHDRGLKHVVIIGETEDGMEYFASSKACGPDILWMLERAKMKLLGVVDESDIGNDDGTPTRA